MEILTNRINTPIIQPTTLPNLENTATNANYLTPNSPPHEISNPENYSDEPYANSDIYNSTSINEPINEINYSDDKYGDDSINNTGKDNYYSEEPAYEEPGKN